MSRMIFLLVASWSVLAYPLHAQEVEEVIGHLSPGQRLRIRVLAGPRQEARVVDSSGIRYILLTDSPTRLTTSTVDSIWVQGRATTEGMVVGGLTFGLAAVVLLPPLIESYYGEGSEAVWDGQSVLVVLGAAAIGAAVGALVGRNISKYKLVHTRVGPARGSVFGRSTAVGLAISLPFRLTGGAWAER